jgi:methylmalonyl-CoA/ethylmalonyl-CoA epimerase
MGVEAGVAQAMSLHLDRIGQIALTVSDLAEAKRFYGETLGMKFLFDAGTMAFYQCGEIRLLIGLGAKPGTPEGGSGAATIFYFRVEEIEAVCAALKGQGVELTQDAHLIAKMPDHDLWMAFVKDPSGNVLGLMSEVRPAAGA